MSIITNIHGIPLFSSSHEAEKYGSKWGLKGYHQHTHDGSTGYMPGETHDKATNWFGTTTVDPKKPWISKANDVITFTETAPSVYAGGSSGSGGGGGGY